MLGAPDLVVEILSPSTAHRERDQARSLRTKRCPPILDPDPDRDVVENRSNPDTSASRGSCPSGLEPSFWA